MLHELKVLPPFMEGIITLQKRFEVRLNDRNYKVGDWLYLREWDGKKYTGVECVCKVLYILEGGQFGIQEGYVVMSISEPTF